MRRPLIAVVGRLFSDEFDQSPIREVDLLRQGFVKIGKALADSDFRIMVYTADPKLDYAAKYVVKGFREGRKKGTPESIIVKRAAVELTDRFPEEDTDPRYLLDVRAEEPPSTRTGVSDPTAYKPPKYVKFPLPTTTMPSISNREK